MAKGFHIISQKPLREFWEIHPKAEEPLRAWIRLMETTEFREPNAIRQLFAGKVDQVGQFAVFDIGGNKYRLITVIDFDWMKVFIRAILTHKEYDEEKWKRDTFGRTQSKPKNQRDVR